MQTAPRGEPGSDSQLSMRNSPRDGPPAPPESVADDVAVRGWIRRALPWIAFTPGILMLVIMGVVWVDYPAAFNTLLDADPVFLLPAFALVSGFVLTRTIAWALLASSLKLGYARFWGHGRVFLIGWFMGLGLPRGAAPLARLAVLAADKRSVGRGTVAVVVDRLIQVVVAVVLLGVSTAYISSASGRAFTGLLWGIGALLILAFLLALAIRSVPLVRRGLASFRGATAILDDLSAGLRELRRMPRSRVTQIMAISFLAAFLSVTGLFLAARALNLNMQYLEVMRAWAAVVLVVFLPISINGIGPREGVLAAAAAGAGFDSESGVALGLLWFLMHAVSRILAGAAWLVDPGEAGADS